MSLVTLPDGVNNEGGPVVASNKSGANATNTTANPYGDFGTASCRGQVSPTLCRGWIRLCGRSASHGGLSSDWGFIKMPQNTQTCGHIPNILQG